MDLPARQIRLERRLSSYWRVTFDIPPVNIFGGDLAERYGYVNRSFPDLELDSFVEALAMPIASFDKQAIADIKRLVDVASLPTDCEIKPEWDAQGVDVPLRARLDLAFGRCPEHPHDGDGPIAPLQ